MHRKISRVIVFVLLTWFEVIENGPSKSIGANPVHDIGKVILVGRIEGTDLSGVDIKYCHHSSRITYDRKYHLRLCFQRAGNMSFFLGDIVDDED